MRSGDWIYMQCTIAHGAAGRIWKCARSPIGFKIHDMHCIMMWCAKNIGFILRFFQIACIMLVQINHVPYKQSVVREETLWNVQLGKGETSSTSTYSNMTYIIIYLAHPMESRGCSTNTVVTHTLINWWSSNIYCGLIWATFVTFVTVSHFESFWVLRVTLSNF